MAKTLPPVPERLKKLLELESIEKVYVVDEEVGKAYTFEDFSGFVRAAHSEGKEAELSRLGYLSLGDDIDIALSRIEGDWEAWDYESQKTAIWQVAVLTNPETASDAQQPNQLSAIFGEDIVEYLTPGNWEEKKVTIVEATVLPKKVIVLFDQELKQGERKGHNLIEDVKDRDWLDRIVPILYSNGMQTYHDELPKRKSIVDASGGSLVPHDFFALSKSRADKGEDFADGIKKALLNRYCEQIKAKSVDVLEKAFKQAIEEVKELDTYHFDDIVLKSSHDEGVWEGFTMHRIARIKLDDSLHQKMIEEKYVEETNIQVRIAKKISDNAKFNPTTELPPYNEKYKLRHQEIYFDGKIINPLFFPIENGDIFELTLNGSPKFFILVGQECDLIVRSNNGKRKSKLGVLLPINPKAEVPEIKFNCINDGAKTCEIVKPESKNSTYPDHEFELHYFDDTTYKHWFAQFNRPVFVNIDLLDLVAFNPSGKAQMKLSKQEYNEHLFSYSWSKRYSLIRKDLLEKMKFAMSISKRMRITQKEEIMQKIYPAFSFPENILLPRFDGEAIELDLKRIRRLRLPASKTLLEKFTRYQSRVADLHDFAKDIF